MFGTKSKPSQIGSTQLILTHKNILNKGLSRFEKNVEGIGNHVSLEVY